jgi:DNA-binding SARP family transcriptional activator
MDFRILGPLEVDDDGRALELGGARQRALLAILLLRRGQVVSADRLIEDLYGGRPPATAAKSLQAHVSRLRRALAPGQRLQTRGGGYVLEVGEDELDADRCRRLLAEARRELAEGRPEAAAENLAAALGLWRGPPLADVAYEAFAQEEIARLEELRLECREERLEAELALGRHADVTSELEQLVAAHPLRERLRGQLMLALYRAGRQVEALAVYQAGRRALVEELGIDPGRPLQQLERAILNQDPELDLIGAQASPGRAGGRPGRLAAGVFVGREHELTLLERSLADARAGRGRLAVVTGARGIGKSRLADELASRAKGFGVRVLWGACWEAGGAPAYWPWVQALRVFVRDADPAIVGAGELTELLSAGERVDSEAARFRLFDATAAFMRRAAAAQPLLVVLDDLHAADAASLLLLEFAAVELADAPVLLLATYRDTELESGDSKAGAIADATRRASLRLSLSGLSESAVASYIALTAELDAPARLVEEITAETGGNPLRVGEAVRTLAATRRLECGREESNLQGPKPTGT